MAKTRFINDRGLTSRMVLVMFLLGLLYVAVVVGLMFAGLNLAVVIVIAAALLVGQWFFSDKIALASMGAREVTPEQAPELHAMIDRLCAMADMPKPRVAIARMDMPNAFATGRNPNKSVVCVTTGLMNRLSQTELEGVLAHELSHIAHRDVAVMTIASFLGVLAGLVMRFGLYFSGGGGRNNNAAVIVAVMWLGSIAVYVISFLLTRALSRYREFAADRAGAYLTGNPSALASALMRIEGATIPKQDLRAAQPAQAFMFAPAAAGRSLAGILSTHPATEKRVQKLSEISTQLGKEL